MLIAILEYAILSKLFLFINKIAAFAWLFIYKSSIESLIVSNVPFLLNILLRADETNSLSYALQS